MSVDVGSAAPDFTLPNQDREPVTLSAERGRAVVLAFFPAAFTSVCTTELCRFRDSLADLNAANASVFGISVDHPASLKEFARQQQLTFPLLSDFNKEAITSYDVAMTDRSGLRGIARRGVFVIDEKGIVRHREVTEHPGLEPDYDAIFAALAALRAIART
jgi:glutaredoxin-dependent peroxiredoxin